MRFGSNFSQSDISEIGQALEMRGAMQHINSAQSLQALSSSQPRRSANQMLEGITGLKGASGGAMPVMGINGDLFAQRTIKEAGMAAFASGKTEESSLVMFEGQDGESDYGLVVPPPEWANMAAVYVKPLTKDQATRFQLENPEMSVHNLTKKDVKKVEKDYVVRNKKMPKTTPLDLGQQTVMFMTKHFGNYKIPKMFSKELLLEFLSWMYILTLIGAAIYATITFLF